MLLLSCSTSFGRGVLLAFLDLQAKYAAPLKEDCAVDAATSGHHSSMLTLLITSTANPSNGLVVLHAAAIKKVKFYLIYAVLSF